MDRRSEIEEHYKDRFSLELLPDELCWAIDKAEEFWSDAWFEGLKEALSVVEWEFVMEYSATVEGWMDKAP